MSTILWLEIHKLEVYYMQMTEKPDRVLNILGFVYLEEGKSILDIKSSSHCLDVIFLRSQGLSF